MVHTKPDGETLSNFLKRITAWNDGFPVLPPEPKKKTIHFFQNGRVYCIMPNCYAIKEHRHSEECPQGMWWMSLGFRGTRAV